MYDSKEFNCLNISLLGQILKKHSSASAKASAFVNCSHILLTLPTMQKKKKKMAAREWADNKTFQQRNDLLWTGLGQN